MPSLSVGSRCPDEFDELDVSGVVGDYLSFRVY